MSKLTRDQVADLLELVRALRNGKCASWDLNADTEDVLEIKWDLSATAAALQDELLDLDAQEEEESDFAPVVGPKTTYDQAIVDHVEASGVVEEVLKSRNIFVVDEPVKAGSLDPETLVYQARGKAGE